MTIKAKLTTMVGVVLLVILVMTGITYMRSESILDDLLNRAGTESITHASGILRTRILSVMDFVAVANSIFGNVHGTRNGSYEEMEKEASLLLKSTSEKSLLDIYFGYQSNGKLADGSGWDEPSDYDARTREWYVKAVANPEKVIVTNPMVDADTGKVIITVAKAFFAPNRELLGVTAADIEMADIGDFAVNLKILGAGAGVLLTREGDFMAHPNRDFVMGRNILKDAAFENARSSFVPSLLKGQTGFADYTFEGEHRRVFYSPVNDDFFMFIFFPINVVHALVETITTVLLIVAGTALAVVSVFAFLTIRSIARSINAMNASTLKLGSGDFTVHYDDSGRDELALMARSLNSMLRSVSDVMNKIHLESETTSQEAVTLAALSEETLASMEEAAASMERVNTLVGNASSALARMDASVEEIARGAQANAQASAKGAEQAESVHKSINDSVEIVGQAAEALVGLQKDADHNKTLIEELNGAVGSISGFVDVITSIADQTNLLALNAAIEAARAGETGRGFAVVAEEVRKLAEDSANAASEVNKLIDDLQKHSDRSLAATEGIVSSLDFVSKAAATQSAELNRSLDDLENLSNAIQDIAAVAQEQAASSQHAASEMRGVAEANSEIVASGNAIHTSTQETTKAAESIASEAQKLAETATTLQQLVNTFKLKGQDASQKAQKALRGLTQKNSRGLKKA